MRDFCFLRTRQNWIWEKENCFHRIIDDRIYAIIVVFWRIHFRPMTKILSVVVFSFVLWHEKKILLLLLPLRSRFLYFDYHICLTTTRSHEPRRLVLPYPIGTKSSNNQIKCESKLNNSFREHATGEKEIDGTPRLRGRVSFGQWPRSCLSECSVLDVKWHWFVWAVYRMALFRLL